ncbi:MFS transporter [Leptodontidium sp. 2 PMI_412]|nr:MFS transporter [Leptodontidium sp. 2 PMI_412]
MQTQPKHDEMFENIEYASGEKAGDIEETVSIIQERERKNTLSRAISRKLDIHLMPLLCVLFVLSYLDRGNIGNAKTAGAQADLGLSSVQWSWVLLSFYITYTCFEWLVLCWKIFPAHIYVSCLCIGWGAAAMCSGAVHNLGGMIATRVLVGFFEAGFGAGVPYFMSMAYKRSELGVRLAVLLGTSPIANCIAGAMAYGISHIKSDIESWRWILIIGQYSLAPKQRSKLTLTTEGIPTVLIAPVVYFYLMDNVATAKFLTEDERTFAVERLQTIDTTAKSKLSKVQIWAGISDYKSYCHALIHFCCNYSFACLSNFLPTIVQGLGYTSIRAQGLTAPPYLGAFICCVFAAFASNKFGQRGPMTAAFATLGAIGYGLLASQKDTNVRYAAIWFASCGVFPALALNMTWMLNNQAGDTKKGTVMSMLAIFGQCSSFVASTIFPVEDKPYYVKGTAVGCGLTGLIVPISLFLHFKLKAENKRRDALSATANAPEGHRIDVTALGDAHQGFRYFT